jgi:hypothetical protein
MELIANGRGSDSVMASLHQEEARKKSLSGELERLDNLARVVSLDASRLAKELYSRLEETSLPSSLDTFLRLARCS